MSTHMFKEIREIPDVIATQRETNAPELTKLADFLKKEPPTNIVVLGRGSSNNACHYAKYLFETSTNIPVSIAAPSIASIYDRVLNYKNTILIVCSQSGGSPDLIKYAQNAKLGGAKVIGLINNESSLLAKECDFLLKLQAGTEKSVAATKSYVATLYALASLLAMLVSSNELANELYNLPDILDQTMDIKWDPFTEQMVTTQNIFCIGRSYGLSVAKEAALKLKETCQIYAHNYSSTEFFHGPLALINEHFPILHFLINDATHKISLETNKKLIELGAPVFTVDTKPIDERTLVLPKTNPVIQPLIQITAFYHLVEEIARRRNLNPDAPPNLNKVTKTM